MEQDGEYPGVRTAGGGSGSDASARLARFGPSRSAMTARYVAALALIGGLALGEYVSVDRLMRAQETRASFIERSARQRMLVQQAAAASQRLLTARDAVARDSLRHELFRVAENMRATHTGVAHADGDDQSLAGLTDGMRSIYLEEPLRLEERIHRYLEAVESLAAAPDSLTLEGNDDYRHIMVAASGETSARLENVVARLVAETEAQVQRIRLVALAMLIATLVVLVLIAAFIFEPMLRSIIGKRRLLEHAASTLARLSSQDGLTGTANRRAFDRRIQEEWRRAERDESLLGLLLIDVDHFKEYNDHYGHQKGDECLINIARRLEDGISRPGDFVARYGGEEFVVILPNTPASGAVRVAEELRQRVEALAIPHAGKSAAGLVTISVGVAVVDPRRDAGSPLDLVKKADMALYQAKDRGRNRVEAAWSKAPAPQDPDFPRPGSRARV